MAKPLIEVKSLKMYFPVGNNIFGKRKQLKAVDDVSFDLYPGETFGLVGESGCGKTTTGRTIIRLYNPTSGEANFEGQDIAGKMTRNLRKFLTSNIAMIFQDPIESLNPKMTIEEIVGEGLKVRGQNDRSEIRRQVVQMLNKVKFKNLANKMIMEYTIVGETEADFSHGKLGATTPIAKALLGHAVGDIVEAKVPQGVLKFEILDISV